MDYEEDNVCPVCSRTFKTSGGKRAHMSTAKNCAWYKFGKLADLQPLRYNASGEGGAIEIQAQDVGGGNEASDMDPADVIEDLEDEEEDLFHFVPQTFLQPEDMDVVMEEGEAGPGPSTMANRRSRANMLCTLDDDNDERVEEIHPTAGKVIRMDESLHRRWRKLFGDFQAPDGDVEMAGDHGENSYSPFASELDWQIARWVVKDGPGQNSFDRLLKIPGVR